MSDNSLSGELAGTIIAIDETQTFASGFTKREFVIKVEDGKFPQDIKFEMHKDRADVLESLSKGQLVTVGYNIKGNEYNGKYYVNLVAWKVTSNGPRREEPPEARPDESSGDDEIPW